MSKIFGLIFFLFILGGIMYLMLSDSGLREVSEYKTVELSGYSMLSESEYLMYSGLVDSSVYNRISLAEVKSKLESHPYVIKVDVRFDGINKILAELVEKKPKAFIINKNQLNLITEDGEILPVVNNNLISRLPIISNLEGYNGEAFSMMGIKAAFRIIDALQIVDKNMYESLAEVNLRNGGDILILFTGLQFPIVFGKNYESKKILALKNIWNSIVEKKDTTFIVEYIDLRYKNKVFIGKRKPSQLTG